MPALLPDAAQKALPNSPGDGPHEQRRNAIANPCPSSVVAAPDLECLRVGCQRLRLVDRQLADFPRVDEAGGRPSDPAENGGRWLFRVQYDEPEMILPLLSRQDPIHLPSRPDLAFLQLVSGLGLADRRGGPVGRDPGVDPLGPGAERPRDDGLNRDRLVFRVGMEGHAILGAVRQPKPSVREGRFTPPIPHKQKKWNLCFCLE